ncbi:hypothetical protein SSX86_017823 [Deinandra increscens subsp. villosa]|uniref:Mechanosensitive ion channel protein n=1 Tax=Deinandra increscens subsp. villosa TaxID=3103831 RepID=A0AAP0CXK9_9ASTR
MANPGSSFPGYSPNDPFFEIDEKHFSGETTGQFPSNPAIITNSGNLWGNSGKGNHVHSTATSAKEELTEHNKEIRVSFNDAVRPRSAGHRSSTSGRSSGGISRSGEQVAVCTSNAAFKRNSTLMRTKTKSRLTDEPEIDQRSYQKTPKSSHHGKGFSDIEEDELSLLEDMPEDYMKLKYKKWTLLQLTMLISIIAALIFTLGVPEFRNKDLYGLELWKWEVMILVVICGGLVSGWGIRIIVFFIERSFLLRKRVLYFVYGLKKAVQNCIWLGLILIAWQCIFDKKVERVTYGKKVLPYVTRVWVCLLVGTVIWLVKTLIIKVLASNFHVSKYFDRIQDSLFNQYVIETLSGPPVNEIRQEEEEEEGWMMEEIEKFKTAGVSLPLQLKANIFTGFRHVAGPLSRRGKTGKSEGGSPKKHDQNGIRIDELHKMNQTNISAWNMSRMMSAMNCSMLTTLDEQLEDLAVDDEEDEGSTEITSEKQAKIAAKRIFCNVAKPNSTHIYVEDLIRFLRNDEALKTIRLFDGASETKGISKRALKNWVVNVFRERRALALSLNDTKTAVDKLHQMLTVFVGIITIVIWLLILKIATTRFLLFICSQLVLAAFVFGNACKTTFDSIIFLFVMHPFDVGDRCEIDGVQMIVEEMNILTTIFLRYDNQKIAYPNTVLSVMPIANYNRSPDMGDAIDFCIHVSTLTEKIAKMKERITSYVEGKSEHWKPGPMVVARDVEDLNRLKISIWLSHRMNFQDMGERWKRRAVLVEELIKIFKDLDIEFRMLPMDVNVRHLPALASNRFPSNWTTCAN